MLPKTRRHKTGIFDFEVHHCRNLSTETQNLVFHSLRITSVVIKRNTFKIYLRSLNLNNFHTKFMVQHVFNRSATWDVNASRKQKINCPLHL